MQCIEWLRAHYDIEQYIHFEHHARTEHASLCHFVLAASYSCKRNLFLRETMRQSNKTCLYYRIVPPYASNSASCVPVIAAIVVVDVLSHPSIISPLISSPSTAARQEHASHLSEQPGPRAAASVDKVPIRRCDGREGPSGSHPPRVHSPASSVHVHGQSAHPASQRVERAHHRGGRLHNGAGGVGVPHLQVRLRC